MGDSRVDKLAEHMTGSTEDARRELAKSRIETMEAAGLIVIDPADDAVSTRLYDLLLLWLDGKVSEAEGQYIAENLNQDILTVLGEDA